MNSEEKRSKGIYFGGIGLLLFGIGFVIYAIGNIILGSIQTAQMGASTWMKFEENKPPTENSQNMPPIDEIVEELTKIQNQTEEK